MREYLPLLFLYFLYSLSEDGIKKQTISLRHENSFILRHCDILKGWTCTPLSSNGVKEEEPSSSITFPSRRKAEGILCHYNYLREEGSPSRWRKGPLLLPLHKLLTRFNDAIKILTVFTSTSLLIALNASGHLLIRNRKKTIESRSKNEPKTSS